MQWLSYDLQIERLAPACLLAFDPVCGLFMHMLIHSAASCRGVLRLMELVL